ncbi:MAG: TetR/AcrR family transcriptional regulator [Sorangiineae bacterium]|nr:TetR/AcrR family transcriptional regulator [Polyangiaceae bacterium]MEB2322581.1 TetR/AcrR family transcriptional regulator [Sorangiineae bacterium]
MTEPDPISDPAQPRPTLRERKFARTKLALLSTAVERLKEKPLSEITVKELCESVRVSEATFFNYFKKKDDLLHYFIQIWTLDVTLRAREAVGSSAGLAFVEQVFDLTAQHLAEHPRMMQEIIGHMALEPRPAPCTRECEGITLAECLQAFPTVDCVESLPDIRLENLWKPHLERAVELGELPVTLQLDQALLALVSTFFGVPLWLCSGAPERVRTAYREQLDLIWAGLRARAGADPMPAQS